MKKEWIKQFTVASLGFLGLMSVMMVTQLQKHNDLLDRSLMQVEEEKHIEKPFTVAQVSKSSQVN